MSLYFKPGLKHYQNVFRENIIVERNNGLNSFTLDNNPNNRYKNNFFKSGSVFNYSSLSVPLSIVFRSKSNKNLLFGSGVYYEYILSGVAYRKYENQGEKNISSKFKDYEYFGVKRNQWALCVFIRFKYFSIHGIYSLTPIFQNNQGIQLKTHSIGFSFSLLDLKRNNMIF